MLTGAAHADAAQIAAPTAPHTQRPALALLARPETPARAGAGAGIQSAVMQSARIQSAGIQSAAASLAGGSLTGGTQTAGTLTAAVSGAGGAAAALASAPVQSLSPGLNGLAAPGTASQVAGQVAAIKNVLEPAALLAPQATRPGRPAGSSAAAAAGPARGSSPAARGSQHQAANAARFRPPGSGWAGSAVSRPSLRHARRHGVPPSSSDHRKSRGTVPGSRVGLAAGTQTDPAPSGGSGGAAQVVAQLPSSAGTRDLVGNVVRIRVSRRPAGRVAADDPAVSPD